MTNENGTEDQLIDANAMYTLIVLLIGICLGSVITYGALLVHGEHFGGVSDNREAEACEYEVNLIGTKARGFRYTEPELGHCWDCRSDEGTMSDSAMRICDR
jgi:hypothetical protein